jgi:hypothetical protein
MSKMPNDINGIQGSPVYNHPQMEFEILSTLIHQRVDRRYPVNGLRQHWPRSARSCSALSQLAQIAFSSISFTNGGSKLHRGSNTEAHGSGIPKRVLAAKSRPQSEVPHSLSKLFTDILAVFPGPFIALEKVAVLYIMFLTTRWQTSPTQRPVAPWPSQPFTFHFRVCGASSCVSTLSQSPGSTIPLSLSRRHCL